MKRKFTKYPSNYVKASTDTDNRLAVIEEAKKLIKKTYRELKKFDKPDSYVAMPYRGPGMFGYGVSNNLDLCWGEEKYHYEEKYYTEWSITIGGVYDENPKAKEIVDRLVKYLSDNKDIIWGWNDPDSNNPNYPDYRTILKYGSAWSKYGIMLKDHSRE